MTIPGVDISNNQKTVDWDAIAAAGYQFAFAKVSEGLTFVDSYFPRNWAEMKRVGLARGAYHYCHPERNSPEAEAARFLSLLQAGGGLQEGDVLAADVESGTGNLLNWVLRFLRAVEAAVGFKPLFYSGEWFMGPGGLEGDATLGEYGLWFAAYQKAEPPTPAGWPFIAVWQHSATGRVPGVNGNCDLDTFNGTVDDFRRYGKPAATKSPFDDAARWQLVKYLADGSGVADVVAWVEQHEDVPT